jgi:tetratricopeptide (TPR) repeat protein
MTLSAKDGLPPKRGEQQETENKEATPESAPAAAMPDMLQYLQQRPETNETVANLLERTISSLEPALRTSSYCYLARSHAGRGRWHEARRWCQEAIRQDSRAAEAYYLLALVSQQEGDIEGAIANLIKVVYLGQEGPVVHLNLALLYRQQGNRVQARRSLTNVVKIAEKWPADRPMPYGEGSDPHWLLATARRLLLEFERN